MPNDAGEHLFANSLKKTTRIPEYILGIETSCDETAAAVIKNGRLVLSSVVASQIEVHHPYGGVVPELASRKHVEAILPVVSEAVQKAGIDRSQIDAVAVTQGPGLVGALLVGFSFAKAYAYGLGIPWIGVDHLEGHIQSVFLEPVPPSFPFVALLASGGHTAIYEVISHKEMMLLGRTRDDAAGEAFDKVAKMLNLGYPGGRIISSLAQQGNPLEISFPRPFLDKSDFDFSFSGLKTAVNRYLETRNNSSSEKEEINKDELCNIAAGFQEAVVDVLSFKLIRAAEEKSCRHIAVVGGVAANARLRQRIIQEAKERNMKVHIPKIEYCGDNAAMIAVSGYHRMIQGETTDMNADVYSRSSRQSDKVN